ncbi:MAG: acyltransferase [Verrucomicrobiales bacterium]|nr:acyltransferase [Verrucomicrobiales bacterium]
MNNSNMPVARLHGLDELRGWAALLIVFYHFTTWEQVEFPAYIANPLKLSGFYGVSVFYVLSGCVLSIIYGEKLGNTVSLSTFYTKRYLRIAPLFIVILLISTLGAKIVNEDYVFDFWRFFLNFSLLFSWIAPSEHMPVGGWSIGNEIFFYSVFPLLLLLIRIRAGNVLLVLLIIAVTILVSFGLVKPDSGKEFEFSKYVNPLNHVAFFALGMLIGRYSKDWTRWRNFLFPLSLVTFWILSMELTTIDLVTGWPRVILLGLTGIWCWFFFTADLLRNRPMEWLGKISYSLYLVHPIVFLGADGFLRKAGQWQERSLSQSAGFMAICFFVTVVSAWILWRLVEPVGGRLLKMRRAL